jgi:hypothetical protein
MSVSRRIPTAALIAVILIAAPAILSRAPRKLHAQAHAPLGTNLSRIDDWSPEYAFLDAFRQSKPWVSGTTLTFDDGRTIDVDAHGWVRSLQPGQIARTMMFTAPPPHHPSGQYTVTFDGSGAFSWSSNVRVVQSSAGRIVIDVDATRGPIAMNITATSPTNYLRNIHVWMPGAGPGSPLFNPAFLDGIRGYGALRFMNWAVVDGNWSVSVPTTQRTWSDRPTFDDARWSFLKGVPIEVMVALANEIGADAWFSISHLADDDYVRRFAQMVYAQLDPRLKVYVEHSDEVWNGSYAQAPYAQQHGLAAGLSSDPYEAQMRWHAKRSTDIFKIWEDVFPPSRLVRVLSSQAGNPWVSRTVLNFADTARHTDALAIAPYLDVRPVEQDKIVGMNLDQLFNEINTVIEPQMMTAVRMHADLARAAHVSLVAYEGGQSLTALGRMQTDPALNALYDAANRDPRMRDVYGRYLQDWSDVSGGQIFMHFTHCSRWDQYGRFGSLEYLGQPRSQAPKYDALLRWMGR